jgi:hypothetical protein
MIRFIEMINCNSYCYYEKNKILFDKIEISVAENKKYYIITH